MRKLPEAAMKMIEAKNFAHIATLMPDGAPHVSPVWIDHENDEVIVNTAEGRVKLRNIRRDPRVAISIIEQENPYHAILIQGRVVNITNEGADTHIDKMAKKYLGVDRYPYRTAGEKRFVLRIDPLRVTVR